MREAAAAQELVVDAFLVDELERRGVHLHAGDRVRLELVSSTGTPDTSRDELWDAFIGSGGDSGDPDLSVRLRRSFVLKWVRDPRRFRGLRGRGVS